MTSVTNIKDVLDGHVGLDLSCIDRLYLSAYVPNLQVPGQVVRFLTEHLGYPVPSPALFEKIGNRFRREVKAFAENNDIPILHLAKSDRTRWDDRKLDHVHPSSTLPSAMVVLGSCRSSRPRSSSGSSPASGCKAAPAPRSSRSPRQNAASASTTYLWEDPQSMGVIRGLPCSLAESPRRTAAGVK
ncbi:MAG: hypothetical protein WAV54_15615 [Acidimicrobiales bacterium]